MNRFRDKISYPYTIAACTAVLLYVALTHLDVILGALGSVAGYFKVVFLGFVLAYIMNPLAGMFQHRVFRRINSDKVRWTLSVVFAMLTLLLVLGFLLGTLIPQLVDSISRLVSNMDTYLASMQKLMAQMGIEDRFETVVDELFGKNGKAISFLQKNINNILNFSASLGKSLVNFIIALILSVYMLMAKDTLKRGLARLYHAAVSERAYSKTLQILGRCDKILVQYIIFSLLDAAIIGAVNAVFMAIVGMEYIGLVSLIVAAMNLIPTFGPLIGCVIGGFILLLVNPLHALLFVIFTLILQFVDGYILKPKLFSGSLGVSGLLILTAVIVCGNIFGVVGILLAIPFAAVIDFVYREELLPALERHHDRRNTLDYGNDQASDM